jgi:cytochrome c2
MRNRRQAEVPASEIVARGAEFACGFFFPSARFLKRAAHSWCGPFPSSGCQHCHTIGSVGGHRGPNLSNIGRTAKKAAIRKQIVNGNNVMPRFGDVLNSYEIDDLIAYLHSCREKPAK